MYFLYTISLVVIIVLTILVESSFANTNKLTDTYWKVNFKSTKSFPCEMPQPRAVPLHELITEDDDDIYYIFGRNSTLHVTPESIVLHRCENAGCCSGRRKACSILEEEQVTLTFKYYSMTESDYISLSVSNHTRCECAEMKTNNIK